MNDIDRRQIEVSRINTLNFVKQQRLVDCYFSDHFFDRLIERKLQADLGFIWAAVLFVYRNQFEQQTYNFRRYLVTYKKLKIGVEISIGRLSNKRRFVITTVFEADQEYNCDEHLILR